MSDLRFYAFSLKKNYNNFPAYKEDLDVVYNEVCRNGNLLSQLLKYEIDSKDKLHIHSVVQGRKNLYVKRLLVKGWNVDIRPLRTKSDIKRWFNYINKDSYNQYEQEQVFWNHYAKHNYMFIDK